ncbi:MAG: hypothetical protein H6572_02240 [Lewinellaceae bacterium]|nr:hypothetical protein [Lewinellaceae bacterium]
MLMITAICPADGSIEACTLSRSRCRFQRLVAGFDYTGGCNCRASWQRYCCPNIAVVDNRNYSVLDQCGCRQPLCYVIVGSADINCHLPG